MDRLQLAKLVDWAGTLQSRKRLQKVVCLLQVAGCRLDADFFLHHYGPYSRDVAETCDEMVTAGLLEETTRPNQLGAEYSYALSPKAKQLLDQAGSNPRLRKSVEGLEKQKALANELLRTEVRDLELASTIAYMHQREKDWKVAVQKACKFKKVDLTSPRAAIAEKLAQRAVRMAG